MSLGMDFEFSKAQTRPSVCLSLTPVDPEVNTPTTSPDHACLYAAMLPAMAVITKPLKV